VDEEAEMLVELAVDVLAGLEKPGNTTHGEAAGLEAADLMVWFGFNLVCCLFLT
jgi:hypothetical protein